MIRAETTSPGLDFSAEIVECSSTGKMVPAGMVLPEMVRAVFASVREFACWARTGGARNVPDMNTAAATSVATHWPDRRGNT
jgi:hypothetical protein